MVAVTLDGVYDGLEHDFPGFFIKRPYELTNADF